MRDYAKIGSTLWGSKKFRKLSVRDKLVYLYILTSQHARSVGLYALPMGYMTFDTQLDEKAILDALEALEQAQLIETDPREDLIYIVGWIEFAIPSSPNHCKKMIYDICPMPNGRLKTAVAHDLMAAMDEKGWLENEKLAQDVALLKECLSPCEDLAKGLPSAGEGLSPLTLPNLTSSNQTSKKGFSGDDINDVSRGTSEISHLGPPQASRRRLFEEFPQIDTSEQFAERLPEKWALVFEKFYGQESDWKALCFGHAVDFWDRFVGVYAGDLVADGYPDKANWFMAWEHSVEQAWRKWKKMPPKRVVGSGVVETFKRKLKG